MKRRTLFVVLSLALISAILGACARTVPIYRVQDHPIPAATQKLSLEDIERNIIHAGQRRRWQMETVQLGQLTARYSDGKHEAVVEVRFSQTSFTIDVSETVGLRQRDETAHRTLSRWIRNLESDIDDQLYRAGLEAK